MRGGREKRASPPGHEVPRLQGSAGSIRLNPGRNGLKTPFMGRRCVARRVHRRAGRPERRPQIRCVHMEKLLDQVRAMLDVTPERWLGLCRVLPTDLLGRAGGVVGGGVPTAQAERALMQPYLLECGPWIVYFKDHLSPGVSL